LIIQPDHPGVGSLRDLVLAHIGFIQDGHSSFANVKLYRHSHWYHNDRCVFHRDVSGYYTTTHCTRLLGLFPVYRGGDRE